jgi:NAD(P)-dependent dehydrogenase (short-subunit alcohol dehydrogenase family)
MMTIAITGCSTGLGRATAFYFAERGWRVLATVRRPEQHAELLAEAGAKGLGDNLLPVLCDITVAEDVQQLAQAVVAATPALDVLVNNAGTAYAGPLELMPLDEVRAQLEINLIGHLAVTQALLPALKAARGMILNVSSIGGRIAFPMHGPYGMSKFALEAMSEVLRLELAHFGVRVVIVAPGASPTAIWETGLRRGHASPMYARLGEYTPLAEAIEARARQSAVNGFPPELFASTVWRIAHRRHPVAIYFVPRSAGLIVALRRLVPDRLWDVFVRRLLHW